MNDHIHFCHVQDAKTIRMEWAFFWEARAFHFLKTLQEAIDTINRSAQQ